MHRFRDKDLRLSITAVLLLTWSACKNDKDEQVLLSHFSGPMRLGACEVKVDIDFSYLVSVKIQESKQESPSPTSSPAADLKRRHL
jgi:hypothetical protein